MLILTRKHDESIVVTVPPSDTPTEIRVHLCDSDPAKARIGVSAPRRVAIDREEIFESKKLTRDAARQAEKATGVTRAATGF